MAKRTQKRRRRRFAGFKRRFRRRKGPISLLTAIPIGMKAIAEPIIGGNGYIGAYQMYQNTGNPADAVMEAGNILSLNFSGYDMKAGTWNFQKPLATYATILAGYGAHLLANKVGVNRHMARIPFVGKHIQL